MRKKKEKDLLKKSTKQKNMEISRAFFKKGMYEEFNNGYQWKFDLENIKYNFYPTTHIWNSDYKFGKIWKGKGIDSFAKVIGYSPS